jgi:hypothetical protein
MARGMSAAEPQVEVVGEERRSGSTEQEDIARSTSISWLVGAPVEGNDTGAARLPTKD